jgi:hypothetical protein
MFQISHRITAEKNDDGTAFFHMPICTDFRFEKDKRKKGKLGAALHRTGSRA